MLVFLRYELAELWRVACKHMKLTIAQDYLNTMNFRVVVQNCDSQSHSDQSLKTDWDKPGNRLIFPFFNFGILIPGLPGLPGHHGPAESILGQGRSCFEVLFRCRKPSVQDAPCRKAAAGIFRELSETKLCPSHWVCRVQKWTPREWVTTWVQGTTRIFTCRFLGR